MIIDVDALLTEFVVAASGFGAAIREGNSKSAKRHRDRSLEAYRRLRDCGAAGQAALLGLLTNDELPIRYMAAVYALDFAPEVGERTLTEIVEGPPSPVRMLAVTSLSQWRSGLLSF